MVGGVGRGKEFVLPPGKLVHYSNNEGPIYLRMNFPKHIKINPEGKMESFWLYSFNYRSNKWKNRIESKRNKICFWGYIWIRK